MIKKLFSKIKTFFKTRWSFFVGFVFMWIVPIILLNETVALTKEVSAGVKATWVTFVLIFFLLLAFRKYVYGLIVRLKHGLLRGILKILHKGVLYGLFLGVLWGVQYFVDKLFNWCIYSGIAMLIGAIFYIIDEVKISKKLEEDRKTEIRKVINEEKDKK